MSVPWMSARVPWIDTLVAVAPSLVPQGCDLPMDPQVDSDRNTSICKVFRDFLTQRNGPQLPE